MFKKILMLFCCVVLSVSVVGCGNASQSEGNIDDENVETSSGFEGAFKEWIGDTLKDNELGELFSLFTGFDENEGSVDLEDSWSYEEEELTGTPVEEPKEESSIETPVEEPKTEEPTPAPTETPVEEPKEEEPIENPVEEEPNEEGGITNKQWDNLLMFSELLDTAAIVSGNYDMDNRYSYIREVNYATQVDNDVDIVKLGEQCNVWDNIRYISSFERDYGEEKYYITTKDTITEALKFGFSDEWDIRIEPNDYYGEPMMRFSRISAEDFYIESIDIHEDDESYYVTAHAPIDTEIEGMHGYAFVDIWQKEFVKEAMYDFIFSKSNGQLEFLSIDWTFDEEAIAEYKGLNRFTVTKCTYLYYPTEAEIEVPDEVMSAIEQSKSE